VELRESTFWPDLGKSVPVDHSVQLSQDGMSVWPRSFARSDDSAEFMTLLDKPKRPYEDTEGGS